MYEKYKQPLVPLPKFFLRLGRNIAFAFLLVIVMLVLGMYGYHHFEHMSWVDAFSNAAMILSGMGPLGPLTTNAGKIFAGCYALFSGLSFIAIIGVIFAPIVHRFLHQFHLDTD